MSTDLYVALSAQVALEKRMNTIANNVANMNTAGFRAEGVKFETVLEMTNGDPVAFASGGESYISRRTGPLIPTGNNLDAAIEGEGWFSFQAGDQTVYSRDGRFHLTDLGELRTVMNYPVLDPGGSPIVVDPAGGPVEIGEDGGITQGGRRVSAIGLFLIPEDARLARHDNSAVTTSAPVEPVEDMTVNSIRQGYVEGANVNPILEMTRLIEVARAFDEAVAAIQQSDAVTQEAIRTLGPSS
ncbi:MAG: flagellar basal-body rod protein FlgF [Bauldia sp.]|nr:MAG: flagellar basal-body rod protein FlgF [Bauldia sp.]MBZ0228515.1 flagellar basal-body rod protein FlgF [Bauldia sp.]